MPHYLRMLTYASQPQDNWGPARKENRCGRYAIKEAIDYHDRKLDNKSFTHDSQTDNKLSIVKFLLIKQNSFTSDIFREEILVGFSMMR